MYGEVTSIATTRLIVEATSYITIWLHRYYYSVRLCQFSNYFTRSPSSFFLKIGKLDKEVNLTGREFQTFGPWQRIVNFFFSDLFGNDVPDNYWLFRCYIAMNLTEVEKQRRQQVIMTTAHNLSYLKRVVLIDV